MKSIISVVFGATVGGSIVYAMTRKKINDQQKIITDLTIDNQNMRSSLDDINESFDRLTRDSEELYSEKAKLTTRISEYRKLFDIDMIADISAIKNPDIQNECFRQIDEAIQQINEMESVDSDIVDVMSVRIKDIINSYDDEDEDEEEDDDDDEDDVTTTISPKRVILRGVNGTKDLIFNTDPDGGFELIDGSSPENNDYTIMAQNIPPLYNLLHASIKEQLLNHSVCRIDSETFDHILEDIVITISLEYISESDAHITAVDAVIPFEVFQSVDKTKSYIVQEGEVKHDVVIQYLRSTNSADNISSKQGHILNDSVKTTDEAPPKEISDTDDSINFIIDTIGYNKESLKCFINKLGILSITNPEAADTIRTAYIEIIVEIYRLKDANLLNDDEISRVSKELRALISNMKKNYGNQIKSYSAPDQ